MYRSDKETQKLSPWPASFLELTAGTCGFETRRERMKQTGLVQLQPQDFLLYNISSNRWPSFWRARKNLNSFKHVFMMIRTNMITTYKLSLPLRQPSVWTPRAIAVWCIHCLLLQFLGADAGLQCFLFKWFLVLTYGSSKNIKTICQIMNVPLLRWSGCVKAERRESTEIVWSPSDSIIWIFCVVCVMNSFSHALL